MAHDLKPFVMIGQHGLSDSVVNELESTLLKHELLKIKLRVSDRKEKKRRREGLFFAAVSFRLDDERGKRRRVRGRVRVAMSLLSSEL